jgi:hypothetical protein
MAIVHDRCPDCAANAEIHVDDGAALSVVLWECEECASDNVTAWNPRARELVSAEVGFHLDRSPPFNGRRRKARPFWRK